MIIKLNNCAIDLLKLINEKVGLNTETELSDSWFSQKSLNMIGAIEVFGEKYSIEEISFASEILIEQELIIGSRRDIKIDDSHKMPKYYDYDSITPEGQELLKSLN